MENLFEYCFLNIIVTVNFVSDLNISVSTTLKYYHKEALNKKLKLMGGAMKYFSKKLQGHEIFSSMFSWDTKFFWKICKTLRPPSYILNTSAQLGGGGGVPCPFLKIEKTFPDFGKKGPNSDHPWVESSIQNVVLSVSRGEKLRNFYLRDLFFLCFWRKAYQSALTPQNLPCPEKVLVARL